MRPERSFSIAAAELRQGVADLRAFPSADGGRTRRISSPAAVHLTHIAHAGATGRKHIYLLGLDADRLASRSGSDPILDDATRASIGSALQSHRDRAARKERLLFRAFNGLTGKVRLSYSTLADSAGREASPAPLLLDVARHLFDNSGLTYDELRSTMGEPAGPARGAAPLDRTDVWLQTLASGADLVDGGEQILSAWPLLARGLALHASAANTELTEWHGIVHDAANLTGPFADPTRWTSPSSLELLAKCPLAWFYHYALGLDAPEDLEYNAGEWLDPLQHGLLIHRILERFVSEWITKQDQLGSDEAASALFEIVSEELARQRIEMPPPSELIFTQERDRVERSARQFLAQEREHADATWLAVEVKFPQAGVESVFVTSDGTRLLIGGYIDRVDRLGNGALRLVDYKSGGSRRFRVTRKDPPLHGGRMLQPAIYASGASQSMESAVAQFEYRFPRERSPDDRVVLSAAALAPAPAIVSSLLSHLRTGDFLPTNETKDCSYCDYRSICRVTGERQETFSPRASWGEVHAESVPEYEKLRRRRAVEEA